MTDQLQGTGSPRRPATPDNGQLDMFAPTDTSPCPCRPGCGYTGGSLTAAFFGFHERNPQVLGLLADELLKWRGRGLGKCAIDMLFNHLRFLVAFDTCDEEFKMPNNHRSFYSRWLLELYPAFGPVFDTAKAAEADAWRAHLTRSDQAAA